MSKAAKSQAFLTIGLMLIGSSQEERACSVEDPMDPPDCPPDGDGEATYFPYPYDCTKYFECSNGEAVCFQCPNSTVWDQELTTCNHELVVPCVTVTTTLQPVSTTPTTTSSSPPPTTSTTAPSTPTPTTTTSPSTTSPSTTQATSTANPCGAKSLSEANPPIMHSNNMSDFFYRTVIDFEEDIPADGNWNSSCTYNLYVDDFSCDMTYYPNCGGYWASCPHSTCEISYSIQPGDVGLHLSAFNMLSTILISGDNGANWEMVCLDLGKCEVNWDWPEGSDKLVIKLYLTSPSSYYSMVDVIRITGLPNST